MKKRLQKYFATIWPAIIWSVIVFLLLTVPPISIAKEKHFDITHLDKIIHAILFAVLVILWGNWLKPKYIFFSKFLLVLSITVFLSVCYGIVMEYIQLWVGRDFDVWDMLADGAGAVAGWLFLAVKERPR